MREISAFSLILWFSTLIKKNKRRFILLFCIALLTALTSAMAVRSFLKPKYIAEIQFVLANESKPAGLASLVTSFGFDMQSNMESAFSGENIIKMLQSKRIVKNSLLTKNAQDNTIFINSFIKAQNLEPEWSKHPLYKSCFPISETTLSSVSPLQDSFLSVAHKIILKNNLTIERSDKKLSFYALRIKSPDESFARNFSQRIVDEGSRYYIETKTQQARKNLAMLQKEVDSIRSVLGGAIYSTASNLELTYNLNPALATKRVTGQTNQAQSQALLIAYGEVFKNMEMAKINLMKETPLFNLIDLPDKKIAKVQVSRSLVFLGIFLSVMLIGTIVIPIKFPNN